MPQPRNWRQSKHQKRFASRIILNVEELETLPAGTKPRTSCQRSHGVERGSGQRYFLEGRERDIVSQTSIETFKSKTGP